jgi:hypothetical protein
MTDLLGGEQALRGGGRNVRKNVIYFPFRVRISQG